MKTTQFDALLEAVMSSLPPDLKKLLEEVAIVVEDEPSEEILRDMGLEEERPSDLCGLHTGIPLPERSTQDSATMPSMILLFRGPILRMVKEDRLDLREQIQITLLHEIAHHFGFTEEELEERGYG